MTRSHSILFRLVIFGSLFASSYSNVFAQAQLILNGANINIAQGAYLVIENSATNAITRTSGHIISEGEDNILQWNMGTTTGTYVIPWGYGSTDYIPLTFTKTAGTGSGVFLFSTYHTDWENSTALPTGITHLNNASGVDNSTYVVDRFWRIQAQDYTVKPALSSLIFTYLDAEFAAPNTIEEGNLSAERWNSDVSSWTDYSPSTTVNEAANTVTVSSVDAANLYSWWALNYLSDRHWIGGASTAWSDPANWSGTAGGSGGMDIPTTIDAVHFDGVDDTNCILDTDITVSSFIVSDGYSGTITQGANTITINDNAIFSDGIFQGGSADITVGGNFTISGGTFRSTSTILDLKGNFATANGSFVHQNGTVRFSGTDGTTQTISGLPVTNFNNITVTNTAATPGVSVNSNENIIGVLTLANNTTIDADGAANTAIFKLISLDDDDTRDASIAALPAGAQINGNVTVQRYMTIEGSNGGRIYRYISAPVQNATVANLQTRIPVTGSFTGTSVCSGCGTNQSMFLYNEAVITDTNGSGTANSDDGYVDFPETANTETLALGRGYALFVRGNLLTTSALWELRGTVGNANVTPVSFPVTFTSSGTIANDGWNLVGNPFASTLDWNAASGWTKTNIEGTIYVRDNVTGVATSWNGTTGTNGGSRYIAMGQAFWVKADGEAPVLQATESVKAAGTQTTFFREAPLENLLRITMAKGTIRDEVVVHFREDATTGFDAHADARKLLNTTFNISSLLNDGKTLAINSLPSLNCTASTKLKIENAAAGNYNLRFSEVGSFANNIAITLSDHYTGSTVSVVEGGSFDFSVNADPASHGADRFTLNFATPPVNADFELKAADLCEGNDAVIELINSQNGALYSALTSNGEVLNSITGNGGTINLTIPKDNLPAGANTVMIRSVVENCNAAVDKNISFTIAERTDIDSVASAKGCRGQTVTLKAFSTAETGYYNWYESENAAAPMADQHLATFTTPVLQKSGTYYVSAVNALSCEGARKPVQAEIVQFADAQIAVVNDSLRSNYSTGNRWYFNQLPIAGANRQSIKPVQSGIYTVEVTTNGCTTSADREFIITAVDKQKEAWFIHVSPNPTSNEFNIEISDSFKDPREVRVISSIGQVIGFIELQQGNGKKTGKFSMTNHAPGIYIIQVNGSTGTFEVKLLRE